MRVLANIKQYMPDRGLCLTIGNFDGLHLGHKALIERARAVARERDLDFAVMTFWPHPRLVLGGATDHASLATREERLRLLEKLGVPLVFELPFNADIACLSARDFAQKTLLPLSLDSLLVGHDFCMGRGREGTAEVLEKLGADFGFRLERIPALTLDGAPVSSSRLREAIKGGDLREAAAMLGRNYTISGVVTHGDARGRTMGYPTANLSGIATLLPGHGIYATWAHINGQTLPAATSIGTNPTFNGRHTTVETFLLKGGEDLYGKEMRLEFVEKIRDQRKFSSAQELEKQIGLDVKKIEKLLIGETA